MNCKFNKYTSITTGLLMSFAVLSCDISQMEESIASGPTEEMESSLDESGANLRLANLLVEETFESSDPFSRQSQQFSESHSFRVSSDPERSSNQVGRFELRDSDDKTNGGVRSEIGFRETQREGWYSYSVYFPSSGYERDNNPENISQWHQAGGGSPPNAVEVKDDKINFRSINRSDTRDNSNDVYTLYSLGNVERGEWNQYVFHFIHSPNSDGLIEIWHNDKKIHTIKGPNMRRGYDLPNFKMGIYKWSWANERTESSKRVLYFDDVRMGDEDGPLLELVSGLLPSGDSNQESAPSNDSDSDNENSLENGKVSNQEISGFNLIKANIDKDLGTLSNNEVVETNTHKLNIVANISSDFRGEVQFRLSGEKNLRSADDSFPYSLFGDDGRGNYYFDGGLQPGSYELEATSYSNGEVHSTKRVAFTIK